LKRIFISTSSFGKFDTKPLELLKKANLEIVQNPYGRKLSIDELLKLVTQAEGLIAGTETLNGDVLRSLKQLKVISRCGSGLDNIDLNTAKALKIKIFNTPSTVTTAVAELTVGLILSLLRQICLMDRQIRKGEWRKSMGYLLFGKKVGIIGFGQIGRKVAELLKALGAKPFYYDPAVPESEADGCRPFEFSDILKRADIITLHLSSSKDNYHLFSHKQFSKMKKDASFINCSRGEIVDEEALYMALKEGRLAGAAIDVFEKEPYTGRLKELDNVILTPHIGSYAREARIRMESEAAINLLRGLDINV